MEPAIVAGSLSDRRTVPIGCAAVVNPFNAVCLLKPCRLISGSLRAPARASSLATGVCGCRKFLRTRSKATSPCVAPDINTETLLAHACESLASASVMVSDFATFLDGSQRSTMLGIQQVIMLADLAVNRALDNLDPQG